MEDQPTQRLVVVGVLFALLSVDLAPERFGAVAPGRWLVLGALAVGGIGAIRTLPLAGAAERLLIATFGWVLLVAPLSPTPFRSTVVASALLGTAAIGLWVGRHFTWARIEAVATASSVVILAIAVVLGGRGSADGRWLGLSEEANALGEVAAIAVTFGAGALARERVLAVPTVVLGSLVLFQTAAAVPALAAAAGIAVTLWPRMAPPVPRQLIAVVSSVGVAGLSAAALAAVRGAGYESDSLITLNRRTGIWSFLSEHIQDRPLTGYGPWGSGDLLSGAPFDGRVTWGPTHGHNVFIELATMGGLPAAGLFIAAIAITGQQLVRSSDPAQAVAITLLAMSMTEHLVATPSLGLVLIGTIVGASRRPADTQLSLTESPIIEPAGGATQQLSSRT